MAVPHDRAMILEVVLPLYAGYVVAALLVHRARIAKQIGRNPIVIQPFSNRDLPHRYLELVLLVVTCAAIADIALNALAARWVSMHIGIPALRESSGGLATLVPPGSLEEWVAAIERVLTSVDAGGALAAERRVHAAARTWDDHVRRLLPVYEEILSVR